MTKKPIIVGFDPGTTAAIATINLEGQINSIISSKNLKLEEINQEIIEQGYPILISTDKSKTPSKVQELASSMGLEIYNPKKDLTQNEKRKIGEGDNSHEIDASAAAKKAYKDNKDGLLKAKQYAEKQNNQTTSILLKKYFKGIDITEIENEESEESSSKKKTSESHETSKKPKKVKKEKFDRLQRKVKNLESQISSLEQRNQELKEEKNEIKSKFENYKKADQEKILEKKEVRKKQSKINRKEKKINNLNRKINSSKIREKQYKEALKNIEKGANLRKLVESKEETAESQINCVTKDRELADNYQNKVAHIQNLNGIELSEYYVVTQESNEDFKSIIKNYQKQRKDFE